MNTPTTKAALLSAMETGRAEWDTLFSHIDGHTLDEPGVEGVWSVKQIVAHMAGYEEYAAALLMDQLDPHAGAQAALDAFYQQQLDVYRQERPDFPAHLSDTDEDQTNALVVAAYDQSSAYEVLEREREAYQRLLAATRAVSDTQLTQPWRPGGRTLLAILPNQSYAHYRMHLPAIRRWLEQRQRQAQADS
jgi:Protein of unknown function (DUF1706)